LNAAQSRVQDIYNSKDHLQRTYLGSDLKSIDRELASVRHATEKAKEEVGRVKFETFFALFYGREIILSESKTSSAAAVAVLKHEQIFLQLL
jgi:hypothetical protein